MSTTPLSALVERVQTWNPAREPEREFDYIDLSAVDNWTKAITGATRVSGAEAPSRARQLVLAGDVLVSTVRPNLNAVAVVPSTLNGATASTGFTVLRPSPRVDARYLLQWVRSPGFVSDMVRKSTGASYPAVSDRIVKDSLIPTPDLAEQRRIAGILDRADAIRAKRRTVLANLGMLTVSTFLDSFGTDGWRSVTSAPRTRSERGWDWVPLTDVARMATGHTPDRSRPDFWDGDIPWISLPEIRDLDGTRALDTEVHVSPAGVANSSAVVLPEGTVCFSRTASIGFVTEMGRPMATSQDFHNWVPGPALNSRYLMDALRNSRTHLLGSSDGSIHKTIYQRVAERFRVLLPPIDIQRSYATKVRAVDDRRDAIRRALAHDDELFTSLQARAFRGEL